MRRSIGGQGTSSGRPDSTAGRCGRLERMTRLPFRDSRRRLLLGIAGVVLAVLAFACGDEPERVVFMAGSQPAVRRE